MNFDRACKTTLNFAVLAKPTLSVNFDMGLSNYSRMSRVDYRN